MSSESTQTMPRNGAATSADKANKFLSNLGKFATSSGPTLTRDEAAPAGEVQTSTTTSAAAEPSMRVVPVEADHAAANELPQSRGLSVEAAPVGRAKSSRRRQPDADRFDRSFEVAAGRGVRVLTARIPRDLHARIYLVATNNRFAERDAPRTINELVLDALGEWLEKHDAA